MTLRRYLATASAVLLSILPLVACGSDRAGLLTAPSSALSTSPVDQSVIATAETAIVITSLVPGTSCPTLQFKVSTYLIKTDATTRYEGGSCTSLQVGTKLTAVNGSRPNIAELVVYATQITIQPVTTPPPAPAPLPAPTSVQTDGTVTSVVRGTACPDLQFLFGTYLFKISAATAYSQASCADVKVGVHVYIAGTKRGADNFVLVTGLGLKRDGTPGPSPTPGPGTQPTPAPATGPSSFETTVVVSSIVAGSACPYREFMVGGYRLTTSALTRYENGSCADIAAGATLGIVATHGDRDMSVLVSRVTVTRESEPEAEPSEGGSTEVTVDSVVTGRVCPEISFRVGADTVAVSSTTRYDGGMCTDIKAGVVLRLSGTREGDGHVLAARVSFPD